MEKNIFYVIFEILKDDHKLIQDRTVKRGERLVGLYNLNDKTVTYTDINGNDHIFSAKTCKVIGKL